MSRILLPILCLAAFSSATLAQTKKTLDAKVTDVTVFLQGAQVTHIGDVTLKAGDNLITLPNLPLDMDPNSIQVEGNAGYTIVSVRHQVNYLQDVMRNPRIKGISDSLEDAQFRQKELIALKNVQNQEKALLEANRSIGGNTTLMPEDLEEMADFYNRRFKQVEFKLLELGEQEKDVQKEIARLQNQLNALNARAGQNPSEVLITVSAQKEGKATFKVSYMANQAGWYPVYDLRADDINTPIEFNYRAKVYQSTGTDWNKVNLTISTGNPTVGGQIPDLYPWYVYIYNPQPTPRPVALYDKRAEEPMPMAGVDMMEKSKGYAETAANYTTVQANAVNMEFKIGIPYDIPSDNQQYDVTLQSDNLKADYRYVTIPKLDNDAFLRAQVTDWMQYALLPGESNIYFRGTFVGKGYIDPAQANDTLNLSLGRDRSIQVKREQIKDYCKTTSMGGKQETTKAYEITVINTKKQAISLEIMDQIPISQSGEVEVEVEELSGGVYDDKTGKVTWKTSIQPGQSVKYQLRFSVKYPKKKLIGNL
ncbi:MAG: DUF4139 domain-containing protein [Flavobacteriales bacterium]